MKQRCSVSCITWTYISRFTFILILGCIRRVKSPMFHIVARFDFHSFFCFCPFCPVEPISAFYGQDGQEVFGGILVDQKSASKHASAVPVR